MKEGKIHREEGGQTERAVRGITCWGMALNVLLTACKFVIGILSHSHSCIADAVHSLSDFVTDLAVLVGVHFWSAPADSDHPHGHQRIEALVTLFIGVLLGASAVGMMVNALEAMESGTAHAIPGLPVFIVATLSIALKEALYQWTVLVGHRCHSSAVMANAWHHRSDAISSIPVAIVAIAGRFWPQVAYLDYVAAIIVSSMLLRTAWQIAWPAVKELSDQGVAPLEMEEMRRIASAVSGVKDVHKLRTRRLGDGVLLDMHIMVDPKMSVEDGHRICEEAAAEIQRKMPSVMDVMTHLEPLDSIDIEGEITRIAMAFAGVKEVHSVRVRTVLNGYDVDLHVQVAPDMTVAAGHEICRQVRDALLASPLKIMGALIHLEPYYPTR